MNQYYKTQWESVEKENDLFDMLEYREALTTDYAQDKLEKEDYQKLMNNSVASLIANLEEDDQASEWFGWKSNFHLALKSLYEKGNLSDESGIVRAAVVDLVYSEFKEKGIDPQAEFFKDEEGVKNIVSRVSKAFLENKNPEILGIEASKVVFGTKVYDYQNIPSKPSTPKNYKIMKDEQGRIYKVFKDASGNFSNNSIKQRIR